MPLNLPRPVIFHLHVSLFQDEQPQTPVLLFSVRDTGIGIERHIKILYLKLFSQADSSTSRTYGGFRFGPDHFQTISQYDGWRHWRG